MSEAHCRVGSHSRARAPHALDMAEAYFLCRNCRSMGGFAQLDDADQPAVGDQVLTAVPLLPRCACCTRLHRGKLPGPVSNILAKLPEVPELIALCSAPETSPPAAPVHAGLPEADEPRRLVFSFDNLPASRPIAVYRGARGDGVLLGNITVTTEHTLEDVARLLHTELKLPANAQLYRGVRGEQLRVPLNKQQYPRLAMPFFPTEDHCILV